MTFNGLFKKKKEIWAAVKTHEGRIRSNNEDNYSLCGRYKSDVTKKNDFLALKTDESSLLFAVCDGMGGEQYGEIASEIAVQNLKVLNISKTCKEIEANIRDITVEIDKKRQELNARNMGSTLAALYVDGCWAVVCNVGDSRVYFWRGNIITQLSVDHRENGHVLTQYLGVAPDDFIIEPHFSTLIELKLGDKFLICSDGLTDMLPDEEIGITLNKPEEPSGIVDELVEKALKAGGKDNVTAMVVEIR